MIKKTFKEDFFNQFGEESFRGYTLDQCNLIWNFFEPHLKLKKDPKSKIEIPQNMVIQFNEMFPKGKAKKTEKYMRCNIIEISKSFERFFKDYTFDWPTIFSATQAYLNAEENTGNEWTLRSKYFVTKLKDKTLVSELAEWCSRVIDGEDFEEENKSHFEPRVI